MDYAWAVLRRTRGCSAGSLGSVDANDGYGASTQNCATYSRDSYGVWIEERVVRLHKNVKPVESSRILYVDRYRQGASRRPGEDSSRRAGPGALGGDAYCAH